MIPLDGAAPILEPIWPVVAHRPDAFEYVYFASPESVLDGISVKQARREMGVALAESFMQHLQPVNNIECSCADLKIDVVVPVPDTSAICARALAESLSLPMRAGLVKNRRANRTFITSDETKRSAEISQKFTAVPEILSGRSVLLVDDSVVRGTTSKQVVDQVRRAGALYSSPQHRQRFGTIIFTA